MSEEFNSAELAGGHAVGVSGEINGFNADVESRLSNVLLEVGKFVENEAGVLMGHIKLAVSSDEGTVTMNLTDLREGVQIHGKIRPCRKVKYSFMAAVLDVEKDILEHKVFHILIDSGINFVGGDESILKHHHHHENCSCGENHHEHHHDHEHHDHDHHEHKCECDKHRHCGHRH